MQRLGWLTAIALAIVLTAFLAPTSTHADEYPTVLNLPDGWLPEGVVMGHGTSLYAGSRRHGGIYEIDIETGAGRVLYAGKEGRAATGLKFDGRTGYIFASGAGNGEMNVYDSATGREVASYKLAATPGPTFINDVVLTSSGAYVTDSQRPVLYRIPLGPNGELPAVDDIQVINLKGDYTHLAGFNINGIDATASGRLIIVQSNTGNLYEVDRFTGNATRIDINEPVRGDGLLVYGETLYAVVNSNNVNTVLVVKLTGDLRSGQVIRRLSSAGFDAPTTATKFGDKLYIVNGRFSAGNAPTVQNTVVAIDAIAPDVDEGDFSNPHLCLFGCLPFRR